jgi:hypothetical protein
MTKKNGSGEVTKEAVRDMIDEAGQLQASESIARKMYKAKREKLYPLIKELFGIEVVVCGTKGQYQAELSRQEYDDVDVIKLIEALWKDHSGKRLLRQLLRVQIEDARKLLDVDLKEELIQRKKKKDPTLFISPTDPVFKRPEDKRSVAG